MSSDNPKGNAVRQNNLFLKKKRKKQDLTFFLAAFPLLIAFAFISHQLLYAQSHDRASSEFTGEIPTVSVVHPEPVGGVSLEEPGYTMAYTEAPIYAQTSGYLKKWYYDIGAKVQANDVLAEIDTPEVDEELAQAKAQLQVGQPTPHLPQVIYHRDQVLFD